MWEFTTHYPALPKIPLNFFRVFRRPGIEAGNTAMDPTSRDPFDDALSRWRIHPPRDRNFRDSVWRRIDASARLTWAGYLRGHLLGWSFAAMVALVAAGWGGRAIAHARLEAERNAMVVSYLSALDPRVLSKLRP